MSAPDLPKFPGPCPEAAYEQSVKHALSDPRREGHYWVYGQTTEQPPAMAWGCWMVEQHGTESDTGTPLETDHMATTFEPAVTEYEARHRATLLNLGQQESSDPDKQEWEEVSVWQR